MNILSPFGKEQQETIYAAGASLSCYMHALNSSDLTVWPNYSLKFSISLIIFWVIGGSIASGKMISENRYHWNRSLDWDGLYFLWFESLSESREKNSGSGMRFTCSFVSQRLSQEKKKKHPSSVLECSLFHLNLLQCECLFSSFLGYVWDILIHIVKYDVPLCYAWALPKLHPVQDIMKYMLARSWWSRRGSSDWHLSLVNQHSSRCWLEGNRV